MNWNQTGMPAALVSRIGQKREIAEFKSVLSDAQNLIMHPVDAESMALDLSQSGGGEVVEMVKELTTALANAKRELEEANRRYERLIADLARRGISVQERPPTQEEPEEPDVGSSQDVPSGDLKSASDGLAEWEEWDRRFRSLLE